MKFSVITPCFNSQSYIGKTVNSVLNQEAIKSGRGTLEYLILDGASTDCTLEILKQFDCPYVRVQSQPDNGMYHALARGLGEATGDVVSYLNAGDYYFPWAFDVLMDVLESRKCQWVTGMACQFNDRGQAIGSAVPYQYRRAFFQNGLSGRSTPFLQQESTFWSQDLNQLIDKRMLASFKLAGDYFLWNTFSKEEELTIVGSLLGGFRIHSGQLSERRDAYFEEVRRLVRSPSIIENISAAFDKLMWHAPIRIKKLFNPEGLLLFNHSNQRWE